MLKLVPREIVEGEPCDIVYAVGFFRAAKDRLEMALDQDDLPRILHQRAHAMDKALQYQTALEAYTGDVGSFKVYEFAGNEIIKELLPMLHEVECLVLSSMRVV